MIPVDDDRPIETSEDEAQPVTLASLSERTKVFEMLAMPERLASAERALHRAGYTYLEGAEEWKPPLGDQWKGGAQKQQDAPESRATTATGVLPKPVAGIATSPGADHATPAAADGWQLVPVEPTDEMLRAARDWSGNPLGKLSYRAMLAAAPQEGANK